MNKTLIKKDTLIECGCHLGLQIRFWNPKMLPFIASKQKDSNSRREIHLFDSDKALLFLEHAYSYILDLVKAGADIMFVGVKNKNTAPIIAEAASRVKVFYLTQRWLGGLLTNFKTISLNIKKLNELNELLENPTLQEGYTKKELVHLSKQRDKLEKFYGGIKNLQRLPNLLVVFNPHEDITAVHEARKMGIPIIALSNTNTDVDLVDFVVPGNNVSPRSVYLIANLLCDAIAQVQGQPQLIAFQDEIIIPEEYMTTKPKSYERGNISFL